jgi:hypothetical protein
VVSIEEICNRGAIFAFRRRHKKNLKIMKRILSSLAILFAFVFSSCEGPAGPPGPTGYSAEAIVYETIPIDFNAPSYGVFFTFPRPALSSDHVVAYRLVAVQNGVDVWKPIPENFYFANGTFDFGYNFDFTRFDVNFFLEGYDLQTLSPVYTQNQIFRIVIIPGQFARKNYRLDDYKSLESALNLNERDVIKLTVR